jgi:hypothetical protein
MGSRVERHGSETDNTGLLEREKEHWLREQWALVKNGHSDIEHLSIFINVNLSIVNCQSRLELDQLWLHGFKKH